MNQLPDTELLLHTPYITSSSPGIGGAIRSNPEDFVVREIPIYVPCGDGDHLYLRVRKRGLTTPHLIDRLAAHFHVDARDIGSAGLKDKHAITEQWISVPWRPLQIDDAETVVGGLDENIEILEASRHTNKLKMGHLKGNHFTITIRGVHPESLAIAAEVVETLRKKGLPNYYGPQRFGRDQKTFWMGWRALHDNTLDPAIRRNERLRRLALNAVQSAMFNAVLAERVDTSTLDHARVGDILEKSEGGLMRVDHQNLNDMDLAVQSHLASPTGPMFGSRMLQPTDDVEAVELAARERFGITTEHLEKHRNTLRGERRCLRISPDDLTLEECNTNALILGFSLPSGSYATVLLRELMKNDSLESEDS